MVKLEALKQVYLNYRAMAPKPQETVEDVNPLGERDDEVLFRGSYFLPEKILYHIDRVRKEIHDLARSNEQPGYSYRTSAGQFVYEHENEYGMLDIPGPCIMNRCLYKS